MVSESQQQSTPPIDTLYTLGFPDNVLSRDGDEWLDYRALGLTTADIPELIRIATDEYLILKEPDGKRAAAPLHAFRALAQMQASEAIVPLANSLPIYLDYGDIGMEEIPYTMGRFGAAAIAPVAAIMQNHSHDPFARAIAGDALRYIATRHQDEPDITIAVIEAFNEYLRHPDKREDEDAYLANGLIVADLIDLREIILLPQDTIELIRALYHNELAAWDMAGDLEDVEIDLGVREKRSTPKPRYTTFPSLPSLPQPYKPTPKLGRNEPCHCGSGKKYKKCCWQLEH